MSNVVIPPDFWFNKNSGSAIPLISLKYNDVIQVEEIFVRKYVNFEIDKKYKYIKNGKIGKFIKTYNKLFNVQSKL